MIFDFYDIKLKDEEWIYILIHYLKGWTEIPLTYSGGYDIEKLKFYDGFIGTLIRHTEKIHKTCPHFLNSNFVNSWKYQGKLYRVLHKCYCTNKRHKLELPKVEYHGMIAHWTDDYTFEALLKELSADEEYIILEADTKEHFAFNINQFRALYNCEELHTKNEREFIFPMYKEGIKEYRMSINEFVKMKTAEIEIP